jgi:hypothetical protein
MTAIPELLAEGKHPEALVAFGFTLDQQVRIIERIKQHAEVHGPYELTAGVPTHHYNQLNPAEPWTGSNLMIMACSERASLRIIGYRNGSRPEIDFDTQFNDLRRCHYEIECTCERDDDEYDDDTSCVRCDYGRSYCTEHDTYH